MFAFNPSLPERFHAHTPLRLVGEIIGYSRKTVAISTIIRLLGEGAWALTPIMIGLAIDRDLTHGATAGIWLLAAGILCLGIGEATSKALGHAVDERIFYTTQVQTMRGVAQHVSRTGRNTTKNLAAGEIVTASTNDTWDMSMLGMWLGRLFASLIVAIGIGILLISWDWRLGVGVLLGVPVLSGAMSMLIQPFQKRLQVVREEKGKLTALATDTVTGLRVLRGIGGEDVFGTIYRRQSRKLASAAKEAARIESWFPAFGEFLGGIFITGLLAGASFLVLSSDLSVGKVVMIVGLSAYLAAPVNLITNVIEQIVASRIGARRILNVIQTEPAAGTLAERSDDEITFAGNDGPGPDLIDPLTGVRVGGGKLTALVSRRPDHAARCARRLARSEDGTVGDIRYGDQLLREMPIMDVRREIVLCDENSQLFAGTLRQALDPRNVPGQPISQDQLDQALHVASGEDVLSSLEGGWDGEITEKGRSLSGGQRQRVSLARAVALDPPTLVLIEPTSAVDAHTEARIAERLAASRAGKTTVVVTASPLLLSHMDEVIVLRDDHAVACGSHEELMERAAGGDEAAGFYRAVISRDMNTPGGDSPASPDAADDKEVR